MKIETLEQRAQRERDIQTKQMVLEMATRQRDLAQAAIERLTREIQELREQA